MTDKKDNFWGIVAAGLIGAAVTILGVKMWNDAPESQKRGFLKAISKFRLCTTDEVNIRNAVKTLDNSQETLSPRY